MPNIRTQDAPENLSLNPTETGIESIAASARRSGAFTSQIAEASAATGARFGSAVRDVGQVAEDYMTHRDISKGAADGATLSANIIKTWNDTAKNADPNDPSVAEKFRNDVLEPALDKFRGGFNTERSQQFAEQFIDRLRNHMVEKTSADMASLAGIAVKENARRTVNELASAVSSDPSSLDFALDAVGHKIGGMADSSPNLTPAASASVRASVTQEAKESLVKAAISGMIQKNPNIDLDAIQKKYGAYINGAEMKMFQKAAQTQAKADMLQQKQLETYQRQQQERQANDLYAKSFADNVTVDPNNGRLVINPKIVSDTLAITRQHPEAGQESARALLGWVEHQQKNEDAASDPQIKKGLLDRMFDPDHPTTVTDILRAETQGKLSRTDGATMRGLVKELEQSPLKSPVYQDTMKAVHDALVLTNVGIPGKDTVGTAKYAQFVQTFIPQYIAKSRAGTLEPNALDINDPNSMISKAMEPFKRTVAQRISDYTTALGGAATAVRKVGEVPVPPTLGGIAALQYNPATRQWRDQTTGAIYDSAGQPVR